MHKFLEGLHEMEMGEPGFYGPVARHNLHRFWKPEEHRVWDDELRLTGHEMIDAYAVTAEGGDPAITRGTKFTPGEFILGLVTDEDAGDFWDNTSALKLPDYDPDSQKRSEYYRNLEQTITGHSPLPPEGIHQMHRSWDDRCDLAYDTKTTRKFRKKSADWFSGFEVGVRALIAQGRIPISNEEFTRRKRLRAAVCHAH